MSVTGTSYKQPRPKGMASWRPQKRKRQLLNDIGAVLAEYRRFWPLTSRQVAYRLLSLDRYDKSESHFTQVGDALVRARRAGMVSWQAIRYDGIRRRGGGYEALDDLYDKISGLANDYQRNRQEGQAIYLEVWEAPCLFDQTAHADTN